MGAMVLAWIAMPASVRAGGRDRISCSTAPGHQDAAAAPHRYIVDASLGYVWRIVPDARYPEGPAHAVRVAGSELPVTGSNPVPVSPVVRSGMRVHLWIDSAASRMDLAGTALNAACPAERVRVKLTATGAILEGVATAAGDVELLSAHPSQRSRP